MLSNWTAFLSLLFVLSPALAQSNMTKIDPDNNHPCRRECHTGRAPMLCEYTFHIEWYVTMSRACFNCPNVLEDCFRPSCLLGSGTQRPVVVANRQLPGPAIEVCLGDRIQVNVMNMMQNGETVTIHWHGLHQRKSPFMDGTPMITQCPILPHTSFMYEFEADQAGTYFWHAHSGLQRSDGLAGALIIRNLVDPQANLYDVDNLPAVILNDWFPEGTAIDRINVHHYGDADNIAPQILINGRWPASTSLQFDFNSTTPVPFPIPVPAAEYHLHPTLRYRFRTIANTLFRCNLNLTIDGHNLVIITSDGYPTKPQATRSLVLTPGERYDFVPYFTGEFTSSDGVYWLRVRGIGDFCTDKTGLAKIIYVSGETPIVQMVESITKQNGSSVALEVNSLMLPTQWNDDDNNTTESNNGQPMNAVMLEALENNPKIAGKPDMSLVLTLDFGSLESDNRMFPELSFMTLIRGGFQLTPRINHIAMAMPPAPLLSQPDDIPEGLYCNSSHRACPPEEFCQCIHKINVPLNSLVELILVDVGEVLVSNHPMHLHGNSFHVVGMDMLHMNFSLDELLQADKEGRIRRKFSNAPEKDSITVPTGGYTILRFIADNPGAWMLHCHMDSHMDLGMSVIFHVGQEVPLTLPSPNYPRCGNYRPVLSA